MVQIINSLIPLAIIASTRSSIDPSKLKLMDNNNNRRPKKDRIDNLKVQSHVKHQDNHHKA